MRTAIILMAAATVVSCGKSPGEKAAEASTQPAAQAASTAAGEPGDGIDPCSLVADPQAMFGIPVTAKKSSNTGQTSCEWKSEDGRICGLVTLFMPAANSSPDPKVNFAGMVTSLGAFGEVKEVAGIGEEARMVDAGMLGAQVALRTASNAALVASACRSAALGQVELATKLAREVAGKI